MPKDLEIIACSPLVPKIEDFNPRATLPYGLTAQHMHKAMVEFTAFIGFVDGTLNKQGLPRLESILMPANFSSIVGEFMAMNIPKSCDTIVRNKYPNGHPDMIPKGRFPGDSVQHSNIGIEVKGSRYLKGWQGHNPEEIFLMVFVFDSNRPVDPAEGIAPKPFTFKKVYGAQLVKTDWNFSGRTGDSRRTITASVTPSGYTKMTKNWLYDSKT